jgi:hypothetical protein
MLMLEVGGGFNTLLQTLVNQNYADIKRILATARVSLKFYTMGKVISKFYSGTSEYIPKLHDLIIVGTQQIFLVLPRIFFSGGPQEKWPLS